jgi:hypothetical protein
MQFGTNAWTVEMFYFFVTANVPTFGTLIDGGSNSAGWCCTFAASTAQLVVNVVDGSSPFNHGMTDGNWYHLAFVCDGSGHFNIFVNGTSIGIKTKGGATCNPTGSCLIGENSTLGAFSAGNFIDELRVTRGVARYSSNFAPPSTPFPNQ